jgi:cytochrome P450
MLLPDFFTEDHSELWDALRKRGPVVFVEDSVFMDGYCLTRADDVLAALHNSEVFSLNPVLDRPDHARWRAILQPLLSSRAVKHMQPALQDQAAAVVEAVAPQGSCEVIADVAEPYAAQVLLTVLGLPPQDGDRLLRWEKALWAIQRAPLAAGQGARFEDLVQKVEMLAYLAEAFTQRRASPDIAGVMSRLVGDNGFNEVDACAVVEMLIAAGITPFRSAVGFLFLDLARDPRLCASLRENPAGVGAFVEDVLRREPPAPVIIRRAAQNVTVAGVEIPAGARVVLCVGAAIQEDMANGNEARANYWAFGGGPHRCVAVSPAKTALTVLISEWLRTIPAFGLDAESVPPVILDDAVRLSSLPLRWPRAAVGQNR